MVRLVPGTIARRVWLVEEGREREDTRVHSPPHSLPHLAHALHLGKARIALLELGTELTYTILHFVDEIIFNVD